MYALYTLSDVHVSCVLLYLLVTMFLVCESIVVGKLYMYLHVLIAALVIELDCCF